MFCCRGCRKAHSDTFQPASNGPAPVVTLFGASGYMGKNVTGPFLTALKEGRVKELRIPTRDPNTDTIRGFVTEGATAYPVDFNSPTSLDEVLKGSHVVISTLGTGPDSADFNQKLIDAMVAAGVKIFVPSEFGTNHYKVKDEYNHPLFISKKAIYHNAMAKGLNPIRILCGDILEATFGKWFSLDCAEEVWTLVGDGNVQVAMTAERDVGRFTLEGILLAFSKSDNRIPDELEVYSCQMTMREYAQAFDKVAGRPTKLEFVTLEEAKEEYNNSGQEFTKLLRILFSENVYDYTNSIANDLLNPGGKIWKLKTIQEYAEETGGRPYKDFGK